MKDNRFKIALYDTTIKDITKRKANRIEYDSVKKASQKLLISETILKRVAKNKERIFIESLGKEFAIRHI